MTLSTSNTVLLLAMGLLLILSQSRVMDWIHLKWRNRKYPNLVKDGKCVVCERDIYECIGSPCGSDHERS